MKRSMMYDDLRMKKYDKTRVTLNYQRVVFVGPTHIVYWYLVYNLIVEIPSHYSNDLQIICADFQDRICTRTDDPLLRVPLFPSEFSSSTVGEYILRHLL